MSMQNDELGDRLVAKGFVPSRYVLDLNHGLMVPVDMTLPAPWNLPSRLFQFPIEVSEPRDGEPQQIGLVHPLLGDHPFVQRVAADLQISLNPDGAPNAHGVGKHSTALWWHAVDLVIARQWRALIETRQFTTDHHIAGAVSFGLDYSPPKEKGGYLTTNEARAILAVIGYGDAPGRGGALSSFSAPALCRQDSGKEHWPINQTRDTDCQSAAWGRIIAIENGWFAYGRDGFLTWTSAGRDRYAAGDKDTFIEAATGQGAFVF